MKTCFGFDSLPAFHRAAVTIGSYDGLHSGHAILLEQTVRRARECGGEAVVMTFEPHPRITLGDDRGLKLLTTLDEKLLLLDRAGVDCTIVIHFDLAFSRLSAAEFLNGYIVGRVQAESLVVGYNHRFGCGKGGDSTFAERNVPALEVVEVGQHRVGERKVSSTIIRRIIEAGDMAEAAELLGHPYIIIGKPGADGRIATDPYKLLPPTGCYAARVDGCQAEVHIDNQRGEISLDGGFHRTKTIIEI